MFAFAVTEVLVCTVRISGVGVDFWATQVAAVCFAIVACHFVAPSPLMNNCLQFGQELGTHETSPQCMMLWIALNSFALSAPLLFAYNDPPRYNSCSSLSCTQDNGSTCIFCLYNLCAHTWGISNTRLPFDVPLKLVAEKQLHLLASSTLDLGPHRGKLESIGMCTHQMRWIGNWYFHCHRAALKRSVQCSWCILGGPLRQNTVSIMRVDSRKSSKGTLSLLPFLRHSRYRWW
jgi:hypothetical protein